MPKLAFCLAGLFFLAPSSARAAEPGHLLYQAAFTAADYGRIPAGWTDREPRRASRSWIVDDRGFLRQTHKNAAGLLTYDGYLATAKPARTLADYTLDAEFKLTGDDQSFGLAARVQDIDSHYLACVRSDGSLELRLHDVDGSKTLAALSPPVRYRDGQSWRIRFELRGQNLTAKLHDAAGKEIARVDAVDDRFAGGPPGIQATTYGAARSFSIAAIEPFEPTYNAAKIAKRNERLASDELQYPVVRPATDLAALETQPQAVAGEYDVVVAGAGTGGFGAAIQAARLGAKVLLIDETDWIGGQAAAAAVSSMDEDSVYRTFAVRERGLYREFHESMVAYYRSLDKDPFAAYYGNPQQEGGYEPKVVRAVLYGLIAETRGRTLADGTHPVLDLCLRTRVEKVRKSADSATPETVTGVTLFHDREAGPIRRDVACRILIDATEYGDVIPLAGARYRVSNTIVDPGAPGAPNPAGPIQDHTWLAVVREYPDGIPPHLVIKDAPPDYDYAARRFKKFQLHGLEQWGAAAKAIKGPRNYRVYFAWRGMADTESPLIGALSERRHTQCGFNGGNDYPVTAATCDDPAQRKLDERFGIYRTLGTLYYFQHELGLNWSLAEDEGFNTSYNRAKMKSLDLRPDLEAIAVHLPQLPYVRESRRIVGVETLVAGDLTRYAEAKHVPTSVAMGDYFMDLDHGHTKDVVETDLDQGPPPRGGGPFQVPFAAFLPEKLDGFLAAEKNFSQSRLANGATRLQPITMLTGQAVGTLAGLATNDGVQPRKLNPLAVQSTLLDSGSTLIQRWYADVPWGTPIWKATQLLSLYQILDRPGPVDGDIPSRYGLVAPLGLHARWGVDQPISADEVRSALMRLATHSSISISPTILPSGDRPISADELRRTLTAVERTWSSASEKLEIADSAAVAAGEFARMAAELLLRTAQPKQK
jgi:hypothetical protein